jgi:hypothetical protein
MTTANTRKIDGIEYVVIRSKSFEHNGDKRELLTLKRPNGKRIYAATVYGNGAVSSVTPCTFIR